MYSTVVLITSVKFSGYLDTWILGYSLSNDPEYPSIQVSKYLDTWILGYFLRNDPLYTWILGYFFILVVERWGVLAHIGL